MASTQLSSELQELSSTTEIVTFNYAELDSETRAAIQQNTTEIKSLMRRTSQDIIHIGQKLRAVKQQLEHGRFRKWLKAEFDWSVSASTKFIQVSEQFKCVNFTHLNIANSALYLLAAPSTPEVARQEALRRASSGETITYSKAKVITQKYKKVIQPEPESTTIDIEAKTLEKDRSSAVSFSQQPTSVSIVPTSNLLIDEQELQSESHTSEPIMYGQSLFQNSNENHLSYTVANANFSTISLLANNNTDVLCQIFINHIERLTDAQILSVWYAIAERVPSELRMLNN
ncbi:hypothetical protein DSM107010_13300 [Chroococcidiopsis cubana SAG 39.79]|uniref:DUF3102 domain-containing protein n=2 Tax=Chroococcidiopsis TaxID=54298 RepID=A0AB37UPL3_9CYAN|nr:MULTISPECIES: DUF3102 domain-containing protein [Chroococcidiopsis]PSB64705.1 hypothetical protein C7B79_08590 [Chroococcidiopsis cubana CCALA 043]RUT13375.1 hypothetical protein DSM107010_13300 [Chroococcidiopsis cubana SAG 39.79]URD49415.1 DUF3102 domain-containing protein [Chroococcidiopsis sp. CCNUC1]